MSSARVRRAPAELVFLLAGAESGHRNERRLVTDADLRGLVEIRRLFRDDERADAARAGRGIGHRGDDEDLADAAVGDESLGAVQQIAVAATHRRRARAAGVAASLGLGESKAAHDLSRRQQRHVAALLLRGAELDDRRGAERRVRGDRERVRRVDLRQLVDHDHEAQQVEPRAAQLLGPRHAEQSELAHLANAFPRELGARVALRGDRRDLVSGELAHHLARREVLFGEIQRIIHGSRR